MRTFADELHFWESWVKPLLHQPAQHRVAWKVGTSTRPGIPDVWTQWQPRPGRWVELKYEREWPKRASTPVRLDVTPEQLSHLRESESSGPGTAFALLGVAHEWFLIPVGLIHRPGHAFAPVELRSNRLISTGTIDDGDVLLRDLFLVTPPRRGSS